MLGIADRELRRVHRHRHAPSARIAIVARERALALVIERALAGQRQRMGRNNLALVEGVCDRFG